MAYKILATLNKDLKNRLKKHSMETGLSMSSIIKMALFSFLPAEISQKEPEEEILKWQMCKSCTASVDPGALLCKKCGSDNLKTIG